MPYIPREHEIFDVLPRKRKNGGEEKMGRIKTEGYAIKSVPCDIMTIKLSFKASAKNSSTALERVIENTEKFLKEIKEQEISTDSFYVGETNLRSSSYKDEKEEKASRTIEIRTKTDMRSLELLFKTISEGNYDVEISQDFSISSLISVHEELTRMALIDAKKKAEAICDCLGVSLSGMDKVWKSDGEFELNEDPMDYELPLMRGEILYRRKAMPIQTEFSELGNPCIEESEEVTVVWLTD